MLKNSTLFGVENKIQISIDRLKYYQPHERLYWLAFSGGKDSIIIYRLAEMANVNFEAHYNLTTVDPPELVHFIRKEYPHVKIDRPKHTMFQYIVKKGPPRRQARWCCEVLKERNPKGAIVITGIRWEESAKRSRRELYEQSTRKKTTYFLHPIIDWTLLDVWEFIEKYKLKYCSLYDEGFDRIGCVLCPMTRTYEQDVKRWPKIVEAYRRALKRFWDKKEAEGSKALKWDNFEEFWNWWIDRDAKQSNPQQKELF